jgi:hypothetical protein
MNVRQRAAWSTFGPHPIGSKRFATVSSGLQRQVAGAILRKQARGQNPDKDEVPGSSPGRPTNHRRRSKCCRQRAGSARCRLGPRWGRTPIPAGTSPGPTGAAHPGVRLGHDHPPWSRPQARGRQPRGMRPPRAAACSRAHRAAARAAAARPNSAARVATDLPLINATAAASPRVPASWTVVEPSTARQPPGPPPVPVVRVPGHRDLVPNATA